MAASARQRELIRAYRSHQRVTCKLLNQRLSANEDSARRTANQLVAAENNQVRAGPNAVHRQRRRGDSVARQIDQSRSVHGFDERQIAFSRQGDQLGKRIIFLATDDGKIARSNLQQTGGVRRDRGGIIVQPRFVRRADFAQHRAGHDRDFVQSKVRFSNLPARNDDFPTPRQTSEGNTHRGRLIIHDRHSLRSRERNQQLLHFSRRIAPLSRRQIQLAIDIAAGDDSNRLNRLIRERHAAKLAIHDHSRRVNHGR